MGVRLIHHGRMECGRGEKQIAPAFGGPPGPQGSTNTTTQPATPQRHDPIDTTLKMYPSEAERALSPARL